MSNNTKFKNRINPLLQNDDSNNTIFTSTHTDNSIITENEVQDITNKVIFSQNLHSHESETIRIIKKNTFRSFDFVYKKVCADTNDMLPYSANFGEQIKVLYGTRLLKNLINVYNNAPKYYQLITGTTEKSNKNNLVMYQKFILLLVIIKYVDLNKLSEEFLNIDSQTIMKQIVNWCADKYFSDLDYSLNGPIANTTYNVDFTGIYAGLIAPANAINNLSEYLQIIAQQSINSAVKEVNQTIKDRDNVYDKNQNYAQMFTIQINSDIGCEFNIDKNNNLSLNINEITLANSQDLQPNLNINTAERTDKLIHIDSKSLSKKMTDIMNHYTIFYISKLLINKQCFKVDITNFKNVYIVFPNIFIDGKISTASNTGSLVVSGKFKNSDDNENIEFIPDSDIGIVYNLTTAIVKKFDFYLTLDPNSLNILSSNYYTNTLLMNRFYNIPILFQQPEEFYPDIYYIPCNYFDNTELIKYNYSILYNANLKCFRILTSNYDYDTLPHKNKLKTWSVKTKSSNNELLPPVINPLLPPTIPPNDFAIRDMLNFAIASGEDYIYIPNINTPYSDEFLMNAWNSQIGDVININNVKYIRSNYLTVYHFIKAINYTKYDITHIKPDEETLKELFKNGQSIYDNIQLLTIKINVKPNELNPIMYKLFMKIIENEELTLVESETLNQQLEEYIKIYLNDNTIVFNKPIEYKINKDVYGYKIIIDTQQLNTKYVIEQSIINWSKNLADKLWNVYESKLGEYETARSERSLEYQTKESDYIEMNNNMTDGQLAQIGYFRNNFDYVIEYIYDPKIDDVNIVDVSNNEINENLTKKLFLSDFYTEDLKPRIDVDISSEDITNGFKIYVHIDTLDPDKTITTKQQLKKDEYFYVVLDKRYTYIDINNPTKKIIGFKEPTYEKTVVFKDDKYTYLDSSTNTIKTSTTKPNFENTYIVLSDLGYKMITNESSAFSPIKELYTKTIYKLKENDNNDNDDNNNENENDNNDNNNNDNVHYLTITKENNEVKMILTQTLPTFEQTLYYNNLSQAYYISYSDNLFAYNNGYYFYPNENLSVSASSEICDPIYKLIKTYPSKDYFMYLYNKEVKTSTLLNLFYTGIGISYESDGVKNVVKYTYLDKNSTLNELRTTTTPNIKIFNTYYYDQINKTYTYYDKNLKKIVNSTNLNNVLDTILIETLNKNGDDNTNETTYTYYNPKTKNIAITTDIYDLFNIFKKIITNNETNYMYYDPVKKEIQQSHKPQIFNTVYKYEVYKYLDISDDTHPVKIFKNKPENINQSVLITENPYNHILYYSYYAPNDPKSESDIRTLIGVEPKLEDTYTTLIMYKYVNTNGEIVDSLIEPNELETMEFLTPNDETSIYKFLNCGYYTFNDENVNVIYKITVSNQEPEFNETIVVKDDVYYYYNEGQIKSSVEVPTDTIKTYTSSEMYIGLETDDYGYILDDDDNYTLALYPEIQNLFKLTNGTNILYDKSDILFYDNEISVYSGLVITNQEPTKLLIPSFENDNSTFYFTMNQGNYNVSNYIGQNYYENITGENYVYYSDKGELVISDINPEDEQIQTWYEKDMDNTKLNELMYYNLKPKNLNNAVNGIIILDSDNKEYAVYNLPLNKNTITFDYTSHNLQTDVVSLNTTSFDVKNLYSVNLENGSMMFVVRSLPKDKNKFKTYHVNKDLLTTNFKFQDLIYSIYKLDNSFDTELDIYYKDLEVSTINPMDRIGHEEEYIEPKYIKYFFNHIDNFNKCIFKTDEQLNSNFIKIDGKKYILYNVNSTYYLIDYNEIIERGIIISDGDINWNLSIELK